MIYLIAGSGPVQLRSLALIALAEPALEPSCCVPPADILKIGHHACSPSLNVRLATNTLEETGILQKINRSKNAPLTLQPSNEPGQDFLTSHVFQSTNDRISISIQPATPIILLNRDRLELVAQNRSKKN
jgi:hypothetical protein